MSDIWCGERATNAQKGSVSPPPRSAKDYFPLTKFYDTGSRLPLGKPGDLIRSASFDDYDLPIGVSAVRILYHSRAANGDDVAASGVILFPDRKPPASGWPMVAWTHEFTGVARRCAPSLRRHLQHGALFSMYVNLGYAVIASDYTGLGTQFRHAFGDILSNAADVVYAIPAARRAVPQLGARWVALGAGSGGAVAVSVAERPPSMHGANYLGSIAIAPLADLQDTFQPSSRFSPHMSLLLAYGIKTIYPQFEISDILGEKAVPFYGQLTDACGAIEPGPLEPVLKPSWESNSFVQDYFRRNRIGQQKARAPLLVITSDADPMRPQTEKTVARLCSQGDRVQFESYAQSDPGRVIGDSVRQQIAWIERQFAGLLPEAQTNCPPRH